MRIAEVRGQIAEAKPFELTLPFAPRVLTFAI
jgi:hypothetical protein